jgi:hypothetical protein
MDWRVVDERLIRRGELLLSLDFLESYDLELSVLNCGKVVPCGLIPGLFRLSSLPFGDSCDVFGSHLRFPISFHLKAYCHASIPLP